MLLALRDDRVQQCQLLLGGAIQPLQAMMNAIGMNRGDLSGQLETAFLGFGFVHDHMDWSTRSDRPHLPARTVYGQGRIMSTRGPSFPIKY